MDFASLGIRIDSTGGRESISELNDLTRAAKGAEGATEQLTPALRATGDAAARMAPPVDAAAAALRRQQRDATSAGLSAKQYSASMRLLPAQITDIVTGLVSGQPAYLVAIQQGGQLRDSFGGIGNTLRALGSILTPTRLAIGGLAGAAALVVKGFLDGQREGQEFAKAIILNGNAAGTTAGELREYAREIDKVVGTQADAARVLAQLSSTGNVGNEQLRQAAQLALQLQRSAGVPIEETVKMFAQLGKEPTRAVKTLNDQYKFLTVEVYKQIAALEEQGRVAEAAALAQGTFIGQMTPRVAEVEENLGSLQSAARTTGEFFREMWDSILDAGRENTLEEQLAEVEARIQRTTASLANPGLLDDINGANRRREENLATDQAERDRIQRQIAEQRNLAKLQADAAAEERRKIEAEAKRTAQAEAQRNAAQREAQQVRQALFASSLAGIQTALSEELAEFDRQSAVLEARRSAGLIGEREYYGELQKLLSAGTAARVQALEEELAALDGQKGTGAEQIRIEDRRRQLLSEIRGLRADEIAQLDVLNIKLQASADSMEQYRRSAREAAQANLESLQQQFARERAAQFQGRREQGFTAGVNDIDDRFAEQRLELERSFANRKTQEDQERYTTQLAVLDEYHKKERAAFEQHWQLLTEAQGDWVNGAKAALQDYLDTARDVASATEDAMSRALGGLEDALVGFVTKGKAGWKDLANSIIADIIRIQLRAQLSGLFSSLLGTGGGGAISADRALELSLSGSFASGAVIKSKGLSAHSGQVVSKPTIFPFARGAGLMGEAGPEAIIPLKRTPGGKLGVAATGTGGDLRVQVNNYAGASVTARQQRSRSPDGEELRELIIDIGAQDMASGGKMASAARQRFGLREVV